MTGVTYPCDSGSEMSWDEILKTGNVLRWCISCGSSFQSCGPDTEKRCRTGQRWMMKLCGPRFV